MTLWSVPITLSTKRASKERNYTLVYTRFSYWLVSEPAEFDTISGTFDTGHARLLFSSKQVEYARYWLHNMGYTEDMVPQLYSDCLLIEGRDLRTVSPVNYETGGDLKGAIKVSTRHTSRISY